MGIDPNNHRLNQIQIVQAQIPVLRANIDNISHEQLKPSSTAFEGMSAEENHACMASSTPKSAHGESKNV
ncbi:hypothetical protein OFM39_36310, partial [Escherichia coli]|nr:hypothetical protein [Escherichia coli]